MVFRFRNAVSGYTSENIPRRARIVRKDIQIAEGSGALSRDTEIQTISSLPSPGWRSLSPYFKSKDPEKNTLPNAQALCD